MNLSFKNQDGELRWGKIATFGFIIILGIITILSSFTSVDAGNVGVVTQFGKITGREMTPGLNIKVPFIQGVWVANIQVQKEQVDAGAASKDLQQVDSTIAVNYHLEADKVSDIYTNLSPDYKNRVIDPAIQEVFKATTSQYNASELLTKRPEVKDVADKALTDRLSKYGIVIDNLSIVNFNFSSDFNNAIEAKQVAQQAAEQAQYSLQKAQLDAQAQEAQKQSLSPELLQKMAIDKWDGKMPTYVGGGSVFNIPLTK